MTDEKVTIDKYVIRDEKSPKIMIYDNERQMIICSCNTVNEEWNRALANIVLDELNTGNYEEVIEDES